MPLDPGGAIGLPSLSNSVAVPAVCGTITCVTALLALSHAGAASAHRLDEYLQATLIGLAPEGIDVEIRRNEQIG